MSELYTTPSVADVAMRNHMKGDNMKSERNWRIKMDKATAEIHDRTRKALMIEAFLAHADRIVELERDKKALEEIGKEAQQMVLDLTDENNRLDSLSKLRFNEMMRLRRELSKKVSTTLPKQNQ